MSKEGDLIISAISEADKKKRNDALEINRKILEESAIKLKIENENTRRRAEILKKSGVVEIIYEIRDRGIKKLKNTPLYKKNFLGLDVVRKDYTPAGVYISDKRDAVTLIFDEWSESYSGYSGNGHSEISAHVGIDEKIIVEGKERYLIDDKTSISEALIMALKNPRKTSIEFERE